MAKTPTVREDFAMVNAFVHGTAANAATINAALAAIGGLSRVLVLPAADRGETFTDWTIDEDVTVPANVTLSKGPGGTLNLLAGNTWIQNGAVWAGRYQIWNLTPGGTLAYNAPGFGFDEWTGNTGQILHWSTGLLTGESNHAAPLGSLRSVTTTPAVLEFKGTGLGNTGWIQVGAQADTTALAARVAQLELDTSALTARVAELELHLGIPAPLLVVTPPAGVSRHTVPGVFAQSTEAVGCPAVCTVAFGGGLTSIQVGDPEVGPDIWGVLPNIFGANTDIGSHKERGLELYNSAPRDVTLTAIGGTGQFDGSGSIRLIAQSRQIRVFL